MNIVSLIPSVKARFPFPAPDLWIEPSWGVTTNSLGGITFLADRSGNGNHLSQTSNTFCPLWYPNAINGRPAIVFDGTDDVLNGLTTLLTGDVDFTLFGVAKKTGSGHASGVAYFQIGTDKHFGVSLGAAGGGTDKAGILNGGIAWTAEPSTLANGTVVRQTLYRAAAGTTYYERNNGVTLSSGTAPGATPYGVFHLGRQASGGSGYQNVSVGEIVFYKRLLNYTERAYVNTYLDKKWAVQQ